MEAARLLQHFSSCEAVEWVNAEMEVKWAVSKDEGHASEGMAVFLDPAQREALGRARNPVSRGFCGWREGADREFQIYVPVYSAGEFTDISAVASRWESS